MERAALQLFRRPLRKDAEHFAAPQQLGRVRDRGCIAGSPFDGERAERLERATHEPVPPQLRLRHVADGARRGQGEQPRVEQRLVVGDEYDSARRRNVLGALELDPVQPAGQCPEAGLFEQVVEDQGSTSLKGRVKVSCTSRSARVLNAASQNAR